MVHKCYHTGNRLHGPLSLQLRQLCVCVCDISPCVNMKRYIMVHAWRSKDDFRCRSLLSTLFETRSLLFNAMYTRWSGQQTSRNFPVSLSLLIVRVLGLQMYVWIWLYVGSGDLNLVLHACMASMLSIKYLWVLLQFVIKITDCAFKPHWG